MPRALDTWPTVAAPRAEDAESDGGHTIVLLGAGPFQDLPYKLALGKRMRHRHDLVCVWWARQRTCQGRVTFIPDPVPGSISFLALFPVLFLASLR